MKLWTLTRLKRSLFTKFRNFSAIFPSYIILCNSFLLSFKESNYPFLSVLKPDSSLILSSFFSQYFFLSFSFWIVSSTMWLTIFLTSMASLLLSIQYILILDFFLNLEVVLWLFYIFHVSPSMLSFTFWNRL